jgi:hypothetical protein
MLCIRDYETLGRTIESLEAVAFILLLLLRRT